MQDELAAQKIEVLFDIHNKRLVSEIKSLKDELSRVKESLSEEIQKLRKELQNIKQDTSYQRQQTGAYQEVAVPKEAPSAPVPEFQPSVHEEKANTPIDRNGVSPSDVSIEKIFYVGK